MFGKLARVVHHFQASCTPFSALHQFFPTLPIILAQLAANYFCKILDGDPLNLKKNIQRLIIITIPVD
jgi:hypothetical protein